MTDRERSPATPDLSVITPAHNEQDNIGPLVEELERALTQTGLVFEVIVVDDGSTDATAERLTTLASDRPWLRVLRMTRTPPGQGGGQSAAFWAGFRASRGRLIASLDADLQNDPADLPRLVDRIERTGADMVQGDRSRARRDNLIRRLGSRVGRWFRRALLGDRIRDTGCSLRVMRREVALAIPLEFKGMHRFIPATARMLGYTVVEVEVAHRPRIAGQTKYGLGISRRAIPGLIDCLAVRWMRSRRRPTDHREVV